MTTTNAMTLLVCGGRDYRKRDTVFATLDAIHAKRGIGAIIEGASTGADALAGEWAMRKGIQLCECYANFEVLGKRAGPQRNAFMATLPIDGAVAFGGGRGTADMITRLKRRGIKVMEVDREHADDFHDSEESGA